MEVTSLMESSRKVSDDVDILPSFAAIPGYGMLPVNAFLLKAQEPVLIDTGMFIDSDNFVSALQSSIDLNDLRWIWLTHPDSDHIGSLHRLLAAAPHLRVITTFLGVGIMSTRDPLPMDRVHFLNPGESLDLGDRTIRAVKPPTFDSPASTGFYDQKSRTFFSSDAFGCLLQGPAHDISEVSEADVAQGQSLWATIDAPWIHKVDNAKFGRELNTIREMSPDVICSAHLPPARGKTDFFLKVLAGIPDLPPFVGPDQAALQAMLAQITGGAPPGA